MILVLALVTATLRPAAPKVGDLITVTFPTPVVLDASRDYEVVEHKGNTFVVRTFTPKPFAMSGVTGAIRFRNLRVPVQSVLKQNDDLKPAPLVPPKAVAYPMMPFVAIGIAALCAITAWIAVALRARKKVEAPVIVQSPHERFRAAVLALRADSARRLRWAALANETRAYLAATRPQLGSDLTTTELVPRLDERDRIVVEILRQGDLEKFSRRGAEPRDFEDMTNRVLELIA
jgi:hypothetical protein